MTATPADCNTGVQPRWGEAPDEPSPWFGAPKPELVGRRCCAAGHDGRAAETVSKLSFASSSPREERAGRGLRRGEFPIKTPLLSPAFSSTSRRRGRRIDRRTSFETASTAQPYRFMVGRRCSAASGAAAAPYRFWLRGRDCL